MSKETQKTEQRAKNVKNHINVACVGTELSITV